MDVSGMFPSVFKSIKLCVSLSCLSVSGMMLYCLILA